MSTRRKVDNRKCLLLKFTNENYQNEVGFASWLSKKDQKNVENLIKARKEVSISWPCNVQIQPAEKIEKDLKTASFEDKSVIILAFGGKFLKNVKRKHSPLFSKYANICNIRVDLQSWKKEI